MMLIIGLLFIANEYGFLLSPPLHWCAKEMKSAIYIIQINTSKKTIKISNIYFSQSFLDYLLVCFTFY